MATLPTGTVALLLTDVPGSAARWERDAAAMAAAMDRLDEIVVSCAGRHGGALVKPRGEGESHFLAFADPAGAVAAAVDIALAAAREPWPAGVDVALRAACHLGPAELRDGDYYGPTVNRCARLRGTAAPGQLLATAEIAAAVAGRLPAAVALADLGRVRLRDVDRPVRAVEVRHPGLPTGFPPLRGAGPSVPRPATSFVGRDADRQAVVAALTPGAIVSLVGPPGSGSTRLALEAAAEHPAGRAGDVAVAHVDEGTGAGAPGSGDRGAVWRALAAAGVDPADAPRLVVLDGADHVLPEALAAADELASLGASVVVPARRRLPEDGRQRAVVLPVGPLAPGDAVRLLLDRAPAGGPSRDLASDPALGAVASACGALPLALELAAARLVLLTPAQLAQRMERAPSAVLRARRPMLVPRHRSLEECVAWAPWDGDGPAVLREVGVAPAPVGG